MTSLQATGLVAGRELRESFRRKLLWIVLAVLFVGSCLAMFLPDVLESGTTHYRVAVVRPTGSPDAAGVESGLRAGVRQLDARLRVRHVATEAEARRLVDDSKVDVGVVPPPRPVIVVRSGENDTLVGVTRQALATDALRSSLRSDGLGSAAIDDALRSPAPRVVELATDSSERTAAAAVLSLVLYLVLLTLMIQVANGVAIEKANRVSEVLLAVVRPGPLLFGKVIGVGLVGLTGFVVAAIPVVVKGVAGGSLPPGLGPAVAGGLAWILLGLVLYLTLAGSLGALVERQEEAGSVLGPLSLLLVGTYILTQSLARTNFGAFLAIFPLTSPIVMPARIALGDASPLEIVVSLVVGAATVVLVVRLGGAIFRRGIVHTGKRLRLGEALRSP